MVMDNEFVPVVTTLSTGAVCDNAVKTVVMPMKMPAQIPAHAFQFLSDIFMILWWLLSKAKIRLSNYKTVNFFISFKLFSV
jgi:hypothetical protein